MAAVIRITTLNHLNSKAQMIGQQQFDRKATRTTHLTSKAVQIKRLPGQPSVVSTGYQP